MKSSGHDESRPCRAPAGPALRLHIGLENVENLKADIEFGFAALNAAQA